MADLNTLAAEIHQIAVDHGFWEGERNMGEMIALMHSELSEALEEHRAGRPAEYVPVHQQGCPASSDGLPDDRPDYARIVLCTGHCKPEGIAVEFADCLIRILDTLASLGIDIDGVVTRKMAYNAGREHRHGKAY